MTAADLAVVRAIAAEIHPAYPEDEAVFAERLALFAAGSLVLEGPSSRIAGYVLSHPWHFGAPPKLDTLLGALPERASTYYLHDLALLPEARGSGAARALVGRLVQMARKLSLPSLSLVAVNGSAGFWQRQQFEAYQHPALEEKLLSYDNGARLMVRWLEPATQRSTNALIAAST